jgi:hypothetical protein
MGYPGPRPPAPTERLPLRYIDDLSRIARVYLCTPSGFFLDVVILTFLHPIGPIPVCPPSKGVGRPLHLAAFNRCKTNTVRGYLCVLRLPCVPIVQPDLMLQARTAMCKV